MAITDTYLSITYAIGLHGGRFDLYVFKQTEASYYALTCYSSFGTVQFSTPKSAQRLLNTLRNPANRHMHAFDDDTLARLEVVKITETTNIKSYF